MRYYINAYDPRGQQVLGNLDGQASINAKQPTRCRAWRRLAATPCKKLSLNGCVVRYELVDSTGRCIASIEPKSEA